MSVFANTIRSIVAGQRPRFPLQNYGWRQVIAQVSPERRACDLVYQRRPEIPFFDCYSASRELQTVLQEEKIRSSLYYLQLPVEGEKRYHHYLLAAEKRGEIALVGFTPFEQLLGIDGVSFVSAEEFASFRAGNSARSYWVDGDHGLAPLRICRPTRQFFYPLGFHDLAGAGVLTEFGVESFGLSFRLHLRASVLKYLSPSFGLQRVSVLSFALSYYYYELIAEVLSDFDQEMMARGGRWKQEMLGRQDHAFLSQALIADWPCFAKLANDIRTNFY